MSKKTFRIVHILYVLLITNIISICYLAIGLFSFSIIPVINANINIAILLFDDKIDGYSGILHIFNEYMKKSIIEYKKSILLVGGYCLSLVVAILFMRIVNTPMAAILNYLFIYLYIMIIIYWAYYFLYYVEVKKTLSYINGLALMFYNPKKLFITIAIGILVLALSVMRKELLFTIFITLFIVIFVKTNRGTIKQLIV